MAISFKARRGDGKTGVCTREWKCMTAGVLMATPCTNSLMMMIGVEGLKGRRERKVGFIEITAMRQRRGG